MSEFDWEVNVRKTFKVKLRWPWVKTDVDLDKAFRGMRYVEFEMTITEEEKSVIAANLRTIADGLDNS